MASSDLFGQSDQLTNQINKLIQGRGQNRSLARQRLENRYDIGGRQSTIEDIRRRTGDVERRLQALPQQLKNRTSGRLVSQGQLDRLTSAEQNPLMQALQGSTRQLGIEQQGLSDLQNIIQQRLGESDALYQDRLNQMRLQQQNVFSRAQAERALEAQRAAAAAQANALRDLYNPAPVNDGTSNINAPTIAQPSDFQKFYRDAVRSGANSNDPAAASRIAQIAKQRFPNLTPTQLNQLEKQVMASQKLNPRPEPGINDINWGNQLRQTLNQNPLVQLLNGLFG